VALTPKVSLSAGTHGSKRETEQGERGWEVETNREVGRIGGLRASGAWYSFARAWESARSAGAGCFLRQDERLTLC
jgi:hypothetical protein